MLVFYFFKRKTAYDVRISDWSSDVCSSDLGAGLQPTLPGHGEPLHGRADGVLTGGRLGKGSGRKPGADGSWAVLSATAALCQHRGAEWLAGGGVPPLGGHAPAPRA